MPAFYSSFCFKYVFVFNLKEVNCRLFIFLIIQHMHLKDCQRVSLNFCYNIWYIKYLFIPLWNKIFIFCLQCIFAIIAVYTI